MCEHNGDILHNLNMISIEYWHYNRVSKCPGVDFWKPIAIVLHLYPRINIRSHHPWLGFEPRSVRVGCWACYCYRQRQIPSYARKLSNHPNNPHHNLHIRLIDLFYFIRHSRPLIGTHIAIKSSRVHEHFKQMVKEYGIIPNKPGEQATCPEHGLGL